MSAKSINLGKSKGITSRALNAGFRHYVTTYGVRVWRNRVRNINREIVDKPYLEEYLCEENSIAFSLSKCSQAIQSNSTIPDSLISQGQIFRALSLVCTLMNMLSEQREKMVQRFHGGIKDPLTMSGLEMELHVAFDFEQNGIEYSFNEEPNGKNKAFNYDFFLPLVGNTGIELECKSFSKEIGSTLKRRDAEELMYSVFEKLSKRWDVATSGEIVLILIKSGCKFDINNLSELVDEIIDLYEVPEKNSETVSLKRIPQMKLTLASIGESLHNNVLAGSQSYARTYRHSSGKWYNTVQITTEKKTKIVGNICKALKTSLKKQFSQKHPAVLYVELQSIDRSELDKFIQNDLYRGSSSSIPKFIADTVLVSANYNHVVAVIVSGKSYVPSSMRTDDVDDFTYSFIREDSDHWHNEVGELLRKMNKIE